MVGRLGVLNAFFSTPEFFSLCFLSTRTFFYITRAPLLSHLKKLTLIKYSYRMYTPYSNFLHHLGDVCFSSKHYFLRPSSPRDEEQPLALISLHLRIRSILRHHELILRECPRTMCVTRCKTHFRTCRSTGTFKQHYPNHRQLVALGHPRAPLHSAARPHLSLHSAPHRPHPEKWPQFPLPVIITHIVFNSTSNPFLLPSSLPPAATGKSALVS